MHTFSDMRAYRALTLEYMHRIARLMQDHRRGPSYAFESIYHAKQRSAMQLLSEVCQYVNEERPDMYMPKINYKCLMRAELLRPIHCELKWARSLLRRRLCGKGRIAQVPLHAAYRLHHTEIVRLRAQAPQVLALIY